MFWIIYRKRGLFCLEVQLYRFISFFYRRTCADIVYIHIRFIFLIRRINIVQVTTVFYRFGKIDFLKYAYVFCVLDFKCLTRLDQYLFIKTRLSIFIFSTRYVLTFAKHRVTTTSQRVHSRILLQINRNKWYNKRTETSSGYKLF